MTAVLSDELLERYQREGYLFPFDVLTSGEVEALRTKLEALEQREGGRLSARTNRKPHLLLTWLNELIRHPKILDAVESVIGPNILCWGSQFFAKSPNDATRVTWHQDSTYWGLSKPDIVTAWVAFTPSLPENGCMRVIPGSHLVDQLPHRETYAADNLLSRGQEVEVEVDERQAVDVVLRPGQMSLHHVRIIHGSEPNRAGYRRIGYAIRYVPTDVRQTAGIPDSATLVRGTDEHHHFMPEPAPKADFDADAAAFHAQMCENNVAILYAGAAKRPDLGPPPSAGAR